MKIANYGNLDHSCCVVIKLNNVHIMLDCGADVSSLTPFLPLSPIHTPRLDNLPGCPENPQVLKKTAGGGVLVNTSLHLLPPDSIDMSIVDAILITNSSQMSALPYLMMDKAFSGRVYATEPCVLMGQLALVALTRYTEQCPTRRRDVDMTTIPSSVHPAFRRSRDLRAIYKNETIEECFNEIIPVRYNEELDLFGLVRCVPVAAGHSIGSANWVIRAGDYKVAYVSASSKLTNHTLPMEVASLASPDVLLLSNLSLNPVYSPSPNLMEVCNLVTEHVKLGGNVLIPCHSTGVLLDLIEWLISHLNKCLLPEVPLIIVSPVADAALAHPDIYGEWLNDAKQAKLYVPELPFVHSQLIKNKRIHHFNSVADGMGEVYRNPCIVFAGHPSLRCGDSVLLLEKWRDDPRNVVILIEPEYPYTPTLAPFLPMAMRSYFFPIDPSIDFEQAQKLIKEIKPRTVVTSPTYFRPPMGHPTRHDLTLGREGAEEHIELGFGDTVNLIQPETTLPIEISPALIQHVELQPLRRTGPPPGDRLQLVSRVTGTISARDNKPLLNPSDRAPRSQSVFGELEVQEVISALSAQGLTPSRVESQSGGHQITLSETASVSLSATGNVSITTASGTIRQTILSTLTSLLIQL